MIEDVISEIKQRHSKQPISQEQFNKWRRMNVTRRLFEELELSVLDSFQDYLPIDSVDNVALKAAERQGAAGMADNVLDWSPAGVEASSDED
jgi:hypothetical protein